MQRKSGLFLWRTSMCRFVICSPRFSIHGACREDERGCRHCRTFPNICWDAHVRVLDATGNEWGPSLRELSERGWRGGVNCLGLCIKTDLRHSPEQRGGSSRGPKQRMVCDLQSKPTKSKASQGLDLSACTTRAALDRSAKSFSAMGIAMSTVCKSAAERA